MNRFDLAVLAAMVLALASSCRSPVRSGAPPRTAASPPAASAAAPAPQPWAVTGFRDDETWQTLGLPPDVNPPFENGARVPRMKRPQRDARRDPGKRLLAHDRP